MTKTLDFSKISEALTPKERAKLVIALEMKGFEAIGYSDEPLPTEAEIKQLVVACPQDQASEYNFLIALHHHVFHRLMPILEILQLELESLSGKISPLIHQLRMAAFTHKIAEIVRQLPVIVPKSEYDQAIDQAKQLASNEILCLNGRFNLCEQEAFHQLLNAGKTHEFTTLDEWLEWIGRHGKSSETLMDEAIARIKLGAEQYTKYKQRAGDAHELFKDYAKYVNMTDDDFKTYVKKEQPGSLDLPTKEEYELWIESLEDNKQHLLAAVKTNELEWAIGTQRQFNRDSNTWNKVEVEGIKAGSYYAWKKRQQKFAAYNPLGESCLEIRHIKDKGAIYANDPATDNVDWGNLEPIAIATPHDEWQYKSEWRRSDKEKILLVLESMCPITMDEPHLGNDDRVLHFSDPHYLEALKNFVSRSLELLQETHNYIGLIEAIEANHFDGMSLSSPDPNSPLGVVARAKETMDNLINQHNTNIHYVLQSFNEVYRGLLLFYFPEAEQCLLSADTTVEPEWVKENLENIEREHRR